MKTILLTLGLSLLSITLKAGKLIPEREWGFDHKQSLAIQKLQKPFYGRYSKKDALKIISSIPREANQEDTFVILKAKGLEKKQAQLLSLVLKNQKYNITSLVLFLKYVEERPGKTTEELICFLQEAYERAQKEKPLVQFKEDFEELDGESDEDSYETATTEPYGDQSDYTFRQIGTKILGGETYFTYEVTDASGNKYTVDQPECLVKETTEPDLKEILLEDLGFIEMNFDPTAEMSLEEMSRMDERKLIDQIDRISPDDLLMILEEYGDVNKDNIIDFYTC